MRLFLARTLGIQCRVGEVGTVVLKDRKKMSEDGLVVVVISVDSDSGEFSGPDIISRGFIYAKESDPLIEEAKDMVKESLSDMDLKSAEPTALKERIIRDLRRFFSKSTGRNPMIIPVIVDY